MCCSVLPCVAVASVCRPSCKISGFLDHVCVSFFLSLWLSLIVHQNTVTDGPYISFCWFAAWIQRDTMLSCFLSDAGLLRSGRQLEKTTIEFIIDALLVLQNSFSVESMLFSSSTAFLRKDLVRRCVPKVIQGMQRLHLMNSITNRPRMEKLHCGQTRV